MNTNTTDPDHEFNDIRPNLQKAITLMSQALSKASLALAELTMDDKNDGGQ